ncbi:MAG TPA: alpha/beta fold hydrolase [Pirellulales bacterium]|nr:alpha/beta fold hydrolase [Pirellulales bacterium]
MTRECSNIGRSIRQRFKITCFTLAISLPAVVLAQKPVFTPVDINREAEYPACGVIDVNKDGKLDIVSGGFWYEASKWQKHFLREVEVIRGRFDDYSNLEYDVNADGWTDIISVNYRSKSLFWLEHPGEKIKTDPESPWAKHVIDTPGPMETGRLHDIDGDGRLDILPNGIGFACWYEIVSGREPKFVKHDLPSEVSAHGIGFGDINGDGRVDIVGPKGWLEAPEDRRGGRWVWHPDWELHRDASIPILVYDVDSDGDNDLVYGRGHNYGLYWLENTNPKRQRGNAAVVVSATAGSPSSASHWTRHAIDTSWAQPHSLLLVDLDGDKRPEVVTGKRYLGHEGKDPGEYDRIEHHCYEFRQDLRTFERRQIADRCAGFGLDPRVVDIDGDGDLDVVAADRNGLSLLVHEKRDLLEEALSAAKTGATPKDAHVARALRAIGGQGPAGPRPDRFQLLKRTEGASEAVIESPFQWTLRREQIVEGMHAVMGPVPDSSRRVPLDVKIESREQTPDYVRIKLTYAAEPGDRVPALLLVPKSLELATVKALTSGQGESPVAPAKGNAGKIENSTPPTGRGFEGAPTGRGFEKIPAMLCLHPTNPDGKAQTAGLVGEATRHYGHQLAQHGFVCLIPDYPSFGDYKAYDFKKTTMAGEYEIPLYVSGTMKAIWNNIRAVDLLESLPYVDSANIGAIGHSLGGHNALYTAVFEPRLKAVVTSCGFNAFHDYYKGDLKGWTSDRYMPWISTFYKNDPDNMPFDFPEVLAAIAPRAVYVSAPLHDNNFEVSGVRKCITAAQPVYELLGGKDKLVVEYPDCGHDFPDDVRERVYGWLAKELR